MGKKKMRWCPAQTVPLWQRRHFPPSCQECCMLTPQSSVPLWELPSVKRSRLIQGHAPSAGAAHIQCLLNMQGYKIPAPASIWNNSEWPSQLQSFLRGHLGPLLLLQHRSAFLFAYSCLPCFLSGVVLKEKTHLRKHPAQKHVSESFARNWT